MGTTTVNRKRRRGSVDELPSGALRVRVYAGNDPVTKKPHYLVETIDPGPGAVTEAEKARTRLLNQVDERRHPRTSATVGQLLDRHLAQLKGERTTLRRYRDLDRLHVRPFIGAEPVGHIDAEIIDSLYAEMRRCRLHCKEKRGIDHRTPRPHDCDGRCVPHRCEPLGEASIRYAHYLLSGAFRRARRWGWVVQNPLELADAPAAPTANPQPPAAADAARLLNQAWRDDPDWGTFVWLAMITGCRRGEVCGLRWHRVDLENRVLHIAKAIGEDDGEIYEKDVKTHQDRRIVLDVESAELLADHWRRCGTRATQLGVELPHDAWTFSGEPDGTAPLRPSTVTQRYGRLCDRLTIDSHLHALRHFSATELIAAGVDIRTVAGRLGHGSGGTTTLRVYTAWLSEADQRAATALFDRLPARPDTVDRGAQVRATPHHPYETIATDIWYQIKTGALPAGTLLPRQKDLAAQRNVSIGTANRAVRLLVEWGAIEYRTPRHAVVRDLPAVPRADVPPTTPVAVTASAASLASAATLNFELVYLGVSVRKFRAEANPDDFPSLKRLLVSAVRRHGGPDASIGDYELDVRQLDGGELITTVVAVD